VMGPSYVSLPHVSLLMNQSDVSEGVFRVRLAVCTVLLDLEKNVFITLDLTKQTGGPTLLGTKGDAYWQSHSPPLQCLP
jgi:hypothetical protein